MKKWKYAFWIIVSLNFLVVILLGGFLLLPSDRQTKSMDISHQKNEEESVPFLISSNKESLTTLINHYLTKETDQENLKYYVELDEHVNVYGTIQAFSKEINMQLILNPIVSKEGNIKLKVIELSIGQLKLPLSYVLKYMQSHYDLPEYVIIKPNDKEIDIQLDELQLKNGFRAKAERFQLETDDIMFTLYVPLP
ncbi:YpmS family protein [Metabacillus malikii]|uniref:Uncharacterized protein YpmS n=1 Tax=Metabacillus malikii TaxID=1504265 RepID=A0ABT9ZAK2_9BACI|nr:YpmS family protein [Metabacillus malikii]MDQ0228877.1 uncharacterized protein YpmS [Metabacillus malikii]